MTRRSTPARKTENRVNKELANPVCGVSVRVRLGLGLGLNSTLQIVLDGKPMKQSDCFRYLGIHLDHCLTWSKHVTWIQSRVYPNLKLLNRILSFRSRNIFFRIYNQAVLPLLDHGCVVWGECSYGNAQCLERPENRAMRIILHADRTTCTQKMSGKLFLLSLYSRRLFLKLQYVYKFINNINCPK